ncbi:MAG: hypothetical protein L3K05_00660, partial [Thermoplasmata archaeon]|nr:hypothetical protein [Thermoplasmata archaeon]
APTPAAAGPVVPTVAARALVAPAVSSGTGAVSLSISVTPGIICVSNNLGCPSDERSARVTMTAAAPALVTVSYPAVQVVFLLETTIYDGAYDGTGGTPGTESCADSSLHEPCEESNAIPFFVTHAGDIANSIAAVNPRSSVTFGLVDFFSTGDVYDDQLNDFQSYAYHVDVGAPVTAPQFGAAVAGSFGQNVLGGGWTYNDADFGDNYLHSDSITALYGVLEGYGINWLPNAHHVLVLIGSTAPRDPSYVQNYCVSASEAWRYACYGGAGPYSDGCEPAYNFGGLVSPSCIGWVSANGGSAESIASLSNTAPDCANSLGKRCTIDVIDLWTTPTDPYSSGWPSSHNGGPGGVYVIQNSQRILTAGCDLAHATNGSWDGPSYYSCPDGQLGDLDYVPYGPVNTPQTSNPSLFAAFRGVSFGPTVTDIAARGGNVSMFRFVPFANVRPAPNLHSETTCLTADGPLGICPSPDYVNGSGFTSLNWNWSNNPAKNFLTTGDLWIASFDVIAVGPPYGSIPVDACTTALCAAGGSGPVSSTWTAARYLSQVDSSPLVESFPLAILRIVYGPEAPVPPGNAPPPATPPPFLSIPSPALPSAAIPTPTAATSIASLSVQALGAGFLGAGFTRLAQKNKPVAVGQANVGPGPKYRKPPPPKRMPVRFA